MLCSLSLEAFLPLKFRCVGISLALSLSLLSHGTSHVMVQYRDLAPGPDEDDIGNSIRPAADAAIIAAIPQLIAPPRGPSACSAASVCMFRQL